MAAPSIGKPFTRSDVDDNAEEGGSFFSKIPIWAWIAGGIIVIYVLYTKFFSNTSSTSSPAVSTTPDQTGSPYTNLDAALSQVLANEQSIASLVGSGSGSPATGASTTPSTTQSSSSAATASAAYAQANQKIAQHNSGPPTAPPISHPSHLLIVHPQGIVGTGGGPNTTGRSSGTKILP